MILMGDSDAAYLVAAEARSRAGGYIYLGNKSSNNDLFNGAVLLIACIIKNVMASAAEAEVGALYINACEMVPLRTTLEEVGHPKPSTALHTDNSTANGILNGTVKQRRSRAIDMRFYWLKDRAEQGFVNLADYYTKHHSPAHHRQVRSIYTSTPSSPTSLQGCAKLLAPRTCAARFMNFVEVKITIINHTNVSYWIPIL